MGRPGQCQGAVCGPISFTSVGFSLRMVHPVWRLLYYLMHAEHYTICLPIATPQWVWHPSIWDLMLCTYRFLSSLHVSNSELHELPVHKVDSSGAGEVLPLVSVLSVDE